MLRWLKKRSTNLEERAPDVPPSMAGGPPLQTVRTDPERLLKRLEWTVVRRLDGMLQGDYRTLFRGAGFDLADLREYLPHDDVRHIDWNVTARLQVPHVREHQEDREVAAWLLLDLSGSVDFGSASVSKRMLALEFSAVVARLLTRRGNRIGALIHSGSHHEDMFVQAKSGRRHVLHLMRSIDSATTGGAPHEATELGTVLSNALAAIKRRSVIFVVSDFITLPGWDRSLSLLARRHDVVAVRLFDPLEVELPDLGMIALRDAETGELLWVDSSDSKFRQRFADAAADREQKLRDALARTGVDCLELATDEALDESLVRFLQLRKRRAQLSAGAFGAAAAAGTV